MQLFTHEMTRYTLRFELSCAIYITCGSLVMQVVTIVVAWVNNVYCLHVVMRIHNIMYGVLVTPIVREYHLFIGLCHVLIIKFMG